MRLPTAPLRLWLLPLLALWLLPVAPARAQSDDGAPADDVPRTVEIGFELFGGYAQSEFFNSGQGGAGLAFRVKDVVTLRGRFHIYGATNTGPGPGSPDDAWALSAGLVLHPFKFYNAQIPDFWVEPYLAADVGVGSLFDKNDGTEFLLAEFLFGLNFDIGRPLVLFFEGGVLYLDFDDKDSQPNSVAQGEFQGGIRYFF